MPFKLTKTWKYRLIIIVGALLVGKFFMDLDWQIMQYHTYGEAATPNGTWNFVPNGAQNSLTGGISLPWWDAYAVTIGAIILGVIMITWGVSRIRAHKEG